MLVRITPIISGKPNPKHIIDTILYNADAPLKPVQSGVIIFEDELDEEGNLQQGNKLSDHRPIFADFRKEQQ